MTKKPMIVLDTATKGLSAQVSYNGITVVNDQATTTLSRAVKLNAWSINGPNVITAQLSPLPEASAANKAAGSSSPVASSNVPAKQPVATGPKLFSLLLRSAFMGADTSGDQELANYKWSETTPLVSGSKREVFTKTIQLVNIPQWAWLGATSVAQLGQEHTQGIAQLLTQLHEALSSKAIDRVVAMQSMQISEQAIAFGSNPDQALQGYRGFLSERMSSSTWRVEPIIWAQIKTTTMANGRVHFVTDAQNGPPIRARAADSLFAIEPYVSMLGQQWVIVR